MGRNVLVVSTVEHEEPTLRGAVGNADRVKVVVPVVKQGLLDWLANDERAFAHAAEVAEETAEKLPADDVDAAAGEANVALAIRDALASFPADEVVVAIRPGDRDTLTERLDPGDGAVRSIDGVPLRFVVIPGPGD
ncbi:MAG TPA: hypothetical protein VIV36_03930 [Gaiella sp.]